MHPKAPHPALFLLCLAIVGCTRTLPDAVERELSNLPERIDYNFHVKPILSDRCYACHGPDANTRKAGLRLDVEREAFARLSSGKKAFVKGNPARSEAFHRIISDNPDYRMPPPDSELSLSAREKAILVKWLDQGAEWKPHWSLIPVTRPPLPEVREDWAATNGIDHFILQKVEEQGLAPSAPADREHLLRRVYLDLTGLPPSVDEIDDFLSDQSPDAYEKVVDHLLSSDAHAERLAMDWLDVARYSDSHGVSFDGARNSWPYKDWVINAFRDNKPYDIFITEQIAGDLLEDPTVEQRIATSFYRMGQLEASMGSIAEEFRVEYVSERTGLTGTAFLGLTVECARCHDHKFDPISQKEYYQLSAFFNTTPEPGLSPVDDDRPPTILLYKPAEKAFLDSLDLAINNQREIVRKTEEEIMEIADFLNSFEAPGEVADPIFSCDFETIEERKKLNKFKSKKGKKIYDDILVLDGNKQAEGTLGVSLTEGRFGNAACFDDEYDFISLTETGLFESNTPFSVSTWIHTLRDTYGPTQTIIGNSNAYPGDYRGWDVFLDSTNHVHVRLIHRLPDDFIEVRTQQTLTADMWTHVGVTYDGSGTADGVAIFVGGKQSESTVLSDCLRRSIHPIKFPALKKDSIPVRIGRSYRIWTYDVGLFEGAIDAVRLYERQLSQIEMAILADNPIDDPDQYLKHEHILLNSPALIESKDEWRRLMGVRQSVLDTVAEVMVMEEMPEPRKTYILQRGLYNKHEEEVQPGTLHAVLAFDESLPQNRLGLARWLTQRENPLTSRVAINRYWQLIFGKGIVKTAEDFGNQGTPPTHPELLDWLAAEFMESDWDLRHMLKLMVMSATYQQSSIISPDLQERDPSNLYYARGSSYRWPAELIRDNVLAASGLLVQKIGGPPVKPYQPEGLWKELGGGSFALATYKQDSLDDLYRRSLYTFQRRFVPPPFMSTFDASDREICRMRREPTNSPLQALALLNDPQVVEASRILSERMQKERSGIDEQITYGFRLSTGVRPSALQLENLTQLYLKSLEKFKAKPTMADSMLTVGDKARDPELDKAQTAALAVVANTIFNSDATYMKR